MRATYTSETGIPGEPHVLNYGQYTDVEALSKLYNVYI